MHLQSEAAADWWARTRPDGSAWVENYKDSLYARHRQPIVDIVQHYAPKTLIEVGCHCGPNLIRLAQDVPSLTDVLGIDASPQAIEAGRQWVKGSGLDGRVELCVGRFPENTGGMATGCAEVVLSCYTLAYVAPGDVDYALYELGRLASKAVILAEPMTTGESVQSHRGSSGYTEWVHNYARSLKWIGSIAGMRVRMVDVTPPVDRLNAILVLERA
jgi:ubiquinone/menaquinone biosynthesis C-methylase UbiE